MFKSERGAELLNEKVLGKEKIKKNITFEKTLETYQGFMKTPCTNRGSYNLF